MGGRDAELQLDAADALVGALDHRPLGAQQIADHAERRDHDGRVEEHGAEDQRLDMAGAAALGIGDDEADPHAQRRQSEQCGDR